MGDFKSFNAAGYQCAHCNLVILGEPVLTMLIDGQERQMCCYGCLSAAEMIANLHTSKQHQAPS